MLPPLRAQGLLPIRIGLAFIALADVDGGLAIQPFGGPLQGSDPPVVERFKMRDGDAAHRALGARGVMGKILLTLGRASKR